MKQLPSLEHLRNLQLRKAQFARWKWGRPRSKAQEAMSFEACKITKVGGIAKVDAQPHIP